MTAEEQKKQEDEKAALAAKKSFYVSMAQYHEREVERFKKQADACDPIALETPARKGNFGGL
jgi:hypothetical protein